MKKYKKMYIANYIDRVFYINKFEMGADAYCEEAGTVEKLRVLSIISSNINNQIEGMAAYNCDYDYDVIFEHKNVTYAVAFEIDTEVDDLPEIEEIIYC